MDRRQLTHLRLVSAVRQVNRFVEFARKSGHTVNVIGMFVRDENGINIVWCQVETIQATDGFFDGETKINQQAGGTIINNGTVTLAATAEGSKAHCLSRVFLDQLQQTLF